MDGLHPPHKIHLLDSNPMKTKSNLLIASGLLIFPFMWFALVLGQAAYFGPMRGAFEKIGRRYLDDLPLGWGLFDVLYYTMPVAALVLVVLGFAVDPSRSRTRLYLGIGAGMVLILALRRWSPGYL
jgi:hypothetical protein